MLFKKLSYTLIKVYNLIKYVGKIHQHPLSCEQRNLIYIILDEKKATTQTNEEFYLQATIVNNSGVTINSCPPNPINIAYHWLDQQENYEQFDGFRTKLPNKLKNNSSITLKLRIKSPCNIGKYELQVGLVQENVTWFEKYNLNHLQKMSIEVLKSVNKIEDYNEVFVAQYAHDRTAVVSHPPAIYNFELTNKCPFKCIMCARTNNMTRSQGIMDFNVFKKAIDEFVEINPSFAKNEGIRLHGFGESLLHPEFGKFISYAVSNGVNAGLSINPLMLTDRVIKELLDAKPAELFISFDGHDDETFKKIRGISNAYWKSKQRLLKFLEQKDRIGCKIRVTVSMINFPDNYESINELENFWRATKGVDYFVIKPFITWDGNADDVKLLHKNTFKSNKNNMVTCDFPWRKMTINWDGDVTPCCYDYNKRYVLGNIAKEPLSEIWNGKKMVSLRKEFISNTVINPLCKNCNSL